MNINHEKTWETYTSSWQIESPDAKKALFEQCLNFECEYNDPLVKTKGWDELLVYMHDFHEKIPGGHFVTTYFLSHNNQSIAKWIMKSGNGAVMGEGISYGKYSSEGVLVSMTGFFELPNE